MELWMGIFMKPTHGVTDDLLTYEFAAGRGAIHFHSILYVEKENLTLRDIPIQCDENPQEILKLEFGPDSIPSSSSQIDLISTKATIDMYNAFCEFDEFINTMSVPSNVTEINPTSLNRIKMGWTKERHIVPKYLMEPLFFTYLP